MAKYFGTVGYSETKETRPGVWEEAITERAYFGDVISFLRRWESAGQLNDNVDINNKISIVADPFACQNFHMMRYVTWMGAKWKVTNVEVQYPRLILTIGGVYREEEDDSARDSLWDSGEPERVFPAPGVDQDEVSGDCIFQERDAESVCG